MTFPEQTPSFIIPASVTPAEFDTFVREVAAEIIGIAGAVVPPAFKPGLVYNLPGATMNASTTVDGNLDLIWWPLSKGTVITDIRECLTTTLGSTGAVRRICAYTADPSTGMPTTLLRDNGTYDATTNLNTLKSGSANGIITVPGHRGIWLGSVTQGAPATLPTIRTVQSTMLNGGSLPVASSPNVFNAMIGLLQTGVTGTLPDPFTTTPAQSTGVGPARQWVTIGSA